MTKCRRQITDLERAVSVLDKNALKLTNTGVDNSTLCNIGDWNSGYCNSGNFANFPVAEEVNRSIIDEKIRLLERITKEDNND